MTRFITLPALLLSSLVFMACDCGCFDEPVAQVPAATTVTPVTLTWEVRGMSCGGCANAIQTKVAKVNGVESCTVSFEEAQAVVIADPAQQEEIEAAITKLGFEATPEKGA